MNEMVVLILSSLLAGTFSTVMSWKMIKNDEFAKKYMETSHKTWIWRKLLGVERATKLTRKFFAPLGLTFGILLILAGLFFLFVVMA
ncbi:hypothetical protein HOC35_01650 [Candidatus Woesearchaeota archaeon]|jgi:hypothetical protein|nr:hypothetical protein [Candidatus Woesearchaeota archaeon]